MSTLARKILAISLCLYATASHLAAQVTLTTIYSFGAVSNASYPLDGSQPDGGLMQASDGNLYGTTINGGTNGWGTVFKITTNGSLTTLYSFGSVSNAQHAALDGRWPYSGLVQGRDGNLYGTTYSGGSNSSGTIYKIALTGAFTSLFSFKTSKNGEDPYGTLVQGSDGELYGTCYTGGTNHYLCGTIFKITTNGNFTLLYAFDTITNDDNLGYSADGQSPLSGLLQGSDGNFYGTTEGGGAYNDGTVFKISPDGVFTTLFMFNQATNGGRPFGKLMQGNDGNLYGTMGNYGADGSAFVMTTNGFLVSLMPFDLHDTTAPYAGLLQGSDGNLYGVDSGAVAGTEDLGALFQLTTSGALTALGAFYGTNGQTPDRAILVQATDGNFYGTTTYGGDYNSGTVYRLSVPLNPPANQISAVQVVGTNVLVTIPSVATESYQLQYRNSLTSGAWSNINAAAVTSIGGPMTVTNYGGASQSQQFFRFAIMP